MSLSIAIMQPTYLPWCGYFALMDRVDKFVILDSVQFAHRSWQQRNQIKTANGPLMLTVPVRVKHRREQHIDQVEIEYPGYFPKKHIRSIEVNYRHAPYFHKYGPELTALLEKHHSHLADMTIEIIDWLRQAFGITTPLIKASGLAVDGHKADLLASICHAVGADHYVSPPGSRVYLCKSSTLAEAGIGLSYHGYHNPPYPQQFGPFMPFCSAIDLLFHMGPESLAVLRAGGRDATAEEMHRDLLEHAS